MAEETAFGIHFACVQEAKASRCASVHGTRRVGCGLFMGGILFFKASGLSFPVFISKDTTSVTIMFHFSRLLMYNILKYHDLYIGMTFAS